MYIIQRAFLKNDYEISHHKTIVIRNELQYILTSKDSEGFFQQKLFGVNTISV